MNDRSNVKSKTVGAPTKVTRTRRDRQDDEGRETSRGRAKTEKDMEKVTNTGWVGKKSRRSNWS